MVATPEIRATQAFSLTAGSGPTTNERTTQFYALTAINFPSPEERSSQAFSLVVATGDATVRTTQAFVLVAVRFGGGDRRLRAWTFTQDDHDFYVLKLGDTTTLVLDLSTDQWSTWSSKDLDTWRAQNGMVWEKDNVAGDFAAGIVWDIDAEDRSDDATTGLIADRQPIQSIVRGLYPLRLRNALGCFRATLTASQGSPVAAGVGVQLRTSDDFGITWVDHGLLIMDIAGKTDYDISWPSIGLVIAPGKIFEVVDTGFARRIDGLDIDLGDGEGTPASAPNGG